MPKDVLHAGRFEAGSVQNGDYIAGSGALKVLVTLSGSVVEKAFVRFRQERFRLHFRVHGLAADVIKSQAEYERTQVINTGDTSQIVSKRILRVEVDFVSALIHSGGSDAPIEHSEIVEIDVGFFSRTRAKFGLGGPPAARKIFSSRSQVRSAIHRPERRISKNRSFDGRSSEVRD